MIALHTAIVLSTALCSLVAGLVLIFACVIMPGLGTLGDREFLQAFQAIDRIIQNRQPIFMLVWVGSVVALLAAGWLGYRHLAGVEWLMLLGATLVYFVGVQVPTATVNVPLNNQLQALDIQTLDAPALAEARAGFEARWNRWNVLRTVFALLTSILLMVLLLKLPS